jgi:hypothetical protein
MRAPAETCLTPPRCELCKGTMKLDRRHRTMCRSQSRAARPAFEFDLRIFTDGAITAQQGMIEHQTCRQ